MARTGGYRGKGQYGTAAHTGGTLDPSMRARGVPDSVVRQGPQAVLAWRQANTAAPAPGRKSAADAAASVTAMMRGGSPPTGAALVKAASDVGVTPQQPIKSRCVVNRLESPKSRGCGSITSPTGW